MKREFKNKSLLERLVFSRFAITVILLLIQLGILISIFLWLGEYATYLFGGMTLISFVVICYIINSEDNPSYKIAWLLPVLLVPVLGTFLYLFIQTNVGTTGPKKLLKDVIHETSAYTKTEESVKEALAKEPVANKICSYIEKTGGYATYQNTEIEY
ncbi:MAG: PLDc N-terminal domain-containing protein, partial [Lachnospiraceae bacterium]